MKFSLNISSGCKGRANLTLFMYIPNQNTIYYLSSKERSNNRSYYSTIMSFYHIRLRERGKYEAVIHCSVLV